MKTIPLPYGRTYLTLSIEEKRLRAVISSGLDQYRAPLTQDELVEEALRRPVGAPPLCELARGKRKVTLIASDHTRPVPSRLIVPKMLREIRRGNPDAAITILIATGCHRGTTRAELEYKFGPALLERETIVVHDCQDEDSLVSIGTLPSGGDCRIHRLAAEADLLVAEGFIEPHFFAGFSGGRKSVLPGVAARETVLANHCAEFIDHPRARTGVLEGNPIHEDMLFAAQKAGLAFIVNVVINSRKEVIAAVAGRADEAHRKGVSFLSGLCRAAPQYSDIVVTTNSGYPLDQNIYQAVKGMTAAEATCNEDGVIVMVAQCEDGHGGDAFYRLFADNPSASTILRTIRGRGRGETLPDQWQAQIFARILERFTVVLVSDAPREMAEALHMRWAPDLDAAMRLATDLKGPCPVTVIPEGVAVVIG